MADGSFDKLVLSISESERDALLDKLQDSAGLVSGPFFDDEDKPRHADDEYAALPLWRKLWYMMLGFIFGKPPARAFEDSLVARSGREINAAYPALYDYNKGLLLPRFYNEISSLKDAVRFFYNALETSVNKDKGAFYAFLASIEAPALLESLSVISDPQNLAERSPNMSPERMKQNALSECAETINSLDAEYRDKMYHNVRSLLCMKALSGFLFDRLLGSFQTEKALDGNVCPAGLIKKQLSLLNDILFSLKAAPPIALLGALFLFSLRDRYRKDKDKIEAELSKMSQQAEKSIVVIKNFDKQVPLTLILRCINRDMAYEPEELSGGEDWFITLRNYWKNLVENNYDNYVTAKKREDIMRTLQIFFGDGEMIRPDHVTTDDDPQGIPIKNEELLTFLLTFYKKVFLGEMNQVLRPILIDGEFYKKANRSEFTESYNELIKLEDLIKDLSMRLGPGGDYGKRYNQLVTDVVAPATKSRKMHTLREDIETESDTIVEKTVHALESLNAVVHGISSGSRDGYYETISNYTTILGKGNRDFREGLKTCAEKLLLSIDLAENILSVAAKERE